MCQNKSASPTFRGGGFYNKRNVSKNYVRRKVGNVQFSHRAAPAVSSGLEGLTTVFGMGTGVAPPLSSPTFLRTQVRYRYVLCAAGGMLCRHFFQYPQAERSVLVKLRAQEGRQRPIFPQGCPCSIVGAGGLNDRVRDGNGCGPSAIVTNLPAHTGTRN